MILVGLLIIVLLTGFSCGAWMLFTSLTPQPGRFTHCGRCGNDLTDSATEYCPKCRRLLSPEMRVTCSRSIIKWPRLGWGAALVLVTFAAALLALRPLLAQAEAAGAASTRQTA